MSNYDKIMIGATCIGVVVAVGTQIVIDRIYNARWDKEYSKIKRELRRTNEELKKMSAEI